MVDVTFGAIRRRRYLDRTMIETPLPDNKRPRNPYLGILGVRPEFADLYQKMITNQVLMQFKTDELDLNRDENQDIKQIVIDLHEYCDKHCTGFWTYTRTYDRDYEYNVQTMVRQDKGNGSGRFIVHFENEADIEPFLKNCALVLKLKN